MWVNQENLYDALISGERFTAGLDVTTPEPLPADVENLRHFAAYWKRYQSSTGCNDEVICQ